MAVDDPSHGRIVPQTVGVIHVLVTAKATEGGLPEKTGHPVLAIFPGPGINQPIIGNGCQAKGIVQFSKRKKARILGDLGAVEFQLKPTVKIEPQKPGFAFTRQVNRRSLSIPASTI